MGEKQMPLAQQTAIWSSGLILQFFAQWLISVLLVRMSGYEAAGIFALAMTVSNVFAYFANYGMRACQLTSRDFSDVQFLWARAVTVGLSLPACMIYLLFAGHYSDTERFAVLLYLLYNSVNTISDTMQGTMQLRGRLEWGGYSNALRGLLCLTGFLLTFLVTRNLLAALGVMAAASLLVTLCYDLPRYRLFLPDGGRNERFAPALRLLSLCFPLMLSQTIPILTTAVPRRTIQALCGAAALGVYSSIFAPCAILLTLIPSIVTAVLPRIAQDWNAQGKDGLRGWLWTGTALIPAVCLLGAAGVFLLGRWGLVLLFGESIMPYSTLLYWAVLAAVFSGGVAYYNGILTVLGQLKAIAAITAAALAGTILTAHAAVAALGIYGAAYLQLGACILQAALQLAVILWYAGKR